MNGQYFAGRLRELRESAGLSQKALADRTGLTVRQVSRLETGIQKPTWETAIALTEALGVDCRAFLEEPADLPKPKRGRPSKAAERAAGGKKRRARPRKGK